jgi:glucose-1-phosphate thymidylyltransferase
MAKKITKALLTAGGRGTRLRPITHTLNKHLIPIANKPMIVHAIEKVRNAGITDIAININVGEQELQRHLGDGSAYGVKITYIEQLGGALGLSHIIKNAKNFLDGKPFLFYLGDNIIFGSINPFVESFIASDDNCCLALSKVKDPQRFGVPEIIDGKIVSIVEKPENPKSNFAVTGIYLYDECIYEAVENIKPSARGELEISDAHQYLLDHGKKIGYKEITGWWKDTGKPSDLIEGNQLLLKEIQHAIKSVDVHPDARIEGVVQIGANTHIDGNVTVRGPVIIGDGCTIRGSYIGPYASIGNGVRVIDTEVEDSIIMDNVALECGARIVDSIVGSDAVVSSAQKTLPHGHKLIIGEHSTVEL